MHVIRIHQSVCSPTLDQTEKDRQTDRQTDKQCSGITFPLENRTKMLQMVTEYKYSYNAKPKK